MKDNSLVEKKMFSVKKGYEKLAFGKTNDILKILFYDKDDLKNEIDSLDLFNISKIVMDKDKLSIEIFDRQEALEKLSEIEKEKDVKKLAEKFLDIGN